MDEYEGNIISAGFYSLCPRISPHGETSTKPAHTLWYKCLDSSPWALVWNGQPWYPHIEALADNVPFTKTFNELCVPAAARGDANMNSDEQTKRSDRTETGPRPRASLAIPVHQDSPEVREKYRPFLLSDSHASDDWVADLELNAAMEMVNGQDRPRILVLYGSVRRRYVLPKLWRQALLPEAGLGCSAPSE